MTALASYSTGTVTVSAGGTTVTGTGTIWSGVNARPGDILQIGNFQTIISDVAGTDELTIPPWGGGAQTGVAYKIWQVSPQRFAGAGAMATVGQLVAALNKEGFYWFVDVAETEPDPSLGNDGQYASQPTTGKLWVKVGGVWTFLGIYKGFSFTGAYNGATTYSVGDVMTDAGTSYVWINPTPGSGHPAPNATYWQVLASKGDTGDTGPTGAGYGGTSTTSRTIGAGAQAFTTQSGLAYQDGARVRATATAGATGWLEGVATYGGTTLTIAGDKISGSGTGTAWNFNVVGEPGAGDLSSANNLSDLENAETARGNLGLTESIVTATIGQLPGTAGTTQPAAGMIGERIFATASRSLASATAANVASITPTAGVWDLEMENAFDGPGATTSNDWTTAIGTVNASVVSGVLGRYHTRLPSGADMSIVHSSRRIRVTTTGSTTYYLNAQAVYSGASYSCSGTIQATRVS